VYNYLFKTGLVTVFLHAPTSFRLSGPNPTKMLISPKVLLFSARKRTVHAGKFSFLWFFLSYIIHVNKPTILYNAFFITRLAYVSKNELDDLNIYNDNFRRSPPFYVRCARLIMNTSTVTFF